MSKAGNTGKTLSVPQGINTKYRYHFLCLILIVFAVSVVLIIYLQDKGDVKVAKPLLAKDKTFGIVGLSRGDVNVTTQLPAKVKKFRNLGLSRGDVNVTKLLPAKVNKFIILDWSRNGWTWKHEHMVNNCLITRNESLLLESHAVVISHRSHAKLDSYPKERRDWQRWVWLMDESPIHSFSGQSFTFQDIRHLFNWTMTYRTKSDVYIPYAWTRRLETPANIPDYFSNRTKQAVAVISNCWSGNGRLEYVKKLGKFVSVDIFGRCSGQLCGGHIVDRLLTWCEKVRDYLFYFAFENSNCNEYITEKAFGHGFQMGAVPVVMGAPKEDYIAITPPNSFIHVSDFAGPTELGQYLTFLSQNRTEYMKYHEWRRNYTTSFRIQYVTTDPIWAALCQALNKDDGQTKIYDDLGKFWTRSECR